MTRNGWRWVGVLGFGALIGLGTVFTDPMFPGWWDLCRHAGSGMAAAAAGLKVTLEQA